MAYRIHLDSSVNCLFIQHFGTYESGEEVELMTTRSQIPHHKKNINVLRDVSLVPLPDDYDLAWFLNHVKTALDPHEVELGTDRKVAWVLNNTQDYEIIHQWCAAERMNSKKSERKPFRDIKAAMEWLEIPEGYQISYPE